MTELRRVPLDRVRAARGRDVVPAGIVRVEVPLTPDELTDLQARFQETAGRPLVYVVVPPVEVSPPVLRRGWRARPAAGGAR